jgi:hypothetical protein
MPDGVIPSNRVDTLGENPILVQHHASINSGRTSPLSAEGFKISINQMEVEKLKIML